MPDMSEFAKWKSHQPFNSAKLWQEMDDSSVDALLDGLAESKDKQEETKEGETEEEEDEAGGQRTKALPKESYFSSCERDKQGHCLPSGEAGIPAKEPASPNSITQEPNPKQEKAAQSLEHMLGHGVGLGADVWCMEENAKFHTPIEYVLAKGQKFTGSPLPKNIRKGVPKECFSNATHLLMQDDTLRYVEGFAVGDWGIPVLHGWCITPDGKVIDNTFSDPENCAYLGVVYDRDAYLKYIMKAKVYGILGGLNKHASKVLATGELPDLAAKPKKKKGK